MPFRGAYNASKFALEGLTDTLRLELRGSGISVSLIEPGPILSRFRANALRALKENIDIEQSIYRDNYKGALARLSMEGPAAPFTLPPEAVLAKVVHALESRRPRPRYYVTVPTYLFGVLKRLLGTRQLDRVLYMAGGEGKR
jgi:NAD(P)-dependent dehydrogenase (short-subunit alcohol dehydrogenase family)